MEALPLPDRAASHELGEADYACRIRTIWKSVGAGNLDEALTQRDLLAADYPEDAAWERWIQPEPMYLAVAGQRIAAGDNQGAIDLLHRLLDRFPDEHLAMLHLSRLLEQQGVREEATRFQHQIRNRPCRTARSWYARAEVLRQVDDLTGAEEAYRRALALDRGHDDAMSGLRKLLASDGRRPELLSLARDNLRSGPRDFGIIFNAALIFGEFGTEMDREALSTTVIELFKNNPDVLYQYSLSFWASGLFLEAARLSHAAVDAGTMIEHRVLAAVMMPAIATSVSEITAARANYHRGLEDLLTDGRQLDDPVRQLPFAPWQLLFCQALGNKNAYAATVRTMEALLPSSSFTAPHCRIWRRRRTGRRLRIGLVCHASMPLLAGLLEHMDRTEFETFHFAPEVAGPAAARWRNAVDVSKALPRDDIDGGCRIIAECRLDVLLLTPYDVWGYGLNLARLAPIQAVIIEPAWTDSARHLDYYISWRAAEPSRLKDHYTSPLAMMRLPPYWCEKDYTKAAAVDRSAFELPQDARWYLCSQNLLKLHPNFDRIIGRILERDSRAIFLIPRGENPQSAVIRRRFRDAFGEDERRVHWLKTLAPPMAHRLLQVADSVVDSWPLGGMSSSFAAVHAAVPVVTMPADIPFGRWLAAIYKYIDVPELIARDEDEFVDLAWRLANDADWHADMCAKLRERRHMLIENREAVRELETFLKAAVKRSRAGKKPCDWIEGAFQATPL